MDNYRIEEVFDAGKINCNELIKNIYIRMSNLRSGQILEVISYDLGAIEDIPAWCRMQGHKLLDVKEDGLFKTHFIIQKR
ncbi:MAG TPA: sulfurtransferase TusA family protein [Haloplasmataceae bacterium]